MELSKDELESRWLEWDSLRKREGIKILIDHVTAETDAMQRNQIFRLIIRKLGGGSSTTAQDLDEMDSVGTHAVAHALKQAENGEEQVFWLEEANVNAYNLSANFCDCWGDGEERQTRHFEQGLVFAEWALDLRRVLQKGPAAFAPVHWVRGKHLLSLKRSYEAMQAFFQAARAEAEVGMEKGLSRESASQVMASAFVGLAQKQAGQDKGIFDESIGLLEKMRDEGGDQSEDAKFYLVQIEESYRLNL